MTNGAIPTVGIAKTFEIRGVYIPFTTNHICHARLRANSNLDWEALLPGLAGDKGAYVVPWADLPGITSLSLHDRALIEGLDQETVLSPAIVRGHSLRVNALGYNGANPMMAAKQVIADDQALETVLLKKMMALFCCHVEGLDPASIEPSALLNPEGQQRLQAAFKTFSATHDISIPTTVERLEAWAQLGVSTGLNEKGLRGHLVKTLDDLKIVADEMSSWIIDEPLNSVAKTRHVMDALLSANKLGEGLFQKIEKLFLNVDESLMNWDTTTAEITHLTNHLYWRLDGWPMMVELWSKTRSAHRYQKRVSVHTIMQFLPIQPIEALTTSQINIWKNLREKQLSWRLIGGDFRPLELNSGILNLVDKYPMNDYV